MKIEMSNHTTIYYPVFFFSICHQNKTIKSSKKEYHNCKLMRTTNKL